MKKLNQRKIRWIIKEIDKGELSKYSIAKQQKITSQHAMFKVKYCHNIFDIKEVREECSRLFDEAVQRYGITIEGRGFDANHVHMKVDMGNY